MDTPAPSTLPELSWLCVLGLTMLPGAFGGILSVLQVLDVPRLLAPIVRNAPPGAAAESGDIVGTRERFWAAILLGALGGVGGAAAVLLLGVWTSQLGFDDTTRNRLLLVSLGVVAGFLGFKLLKSVASSLERQVSEAKQAAQEAEQKSENVGLRLNEAIEDANVITRARALLVDEDTPDAELEETAREMEQVRVRRPGDRVVAIVLGNLYDRIGRHEKAIGLMSKTLGAKALNGTAADKDAADLLFNRACYRIPLLKKEFDASKKDVLKQAILEDLKLSFTYSPANRIDAQGDEDLNALAEDPAFRALLAG